jgi:hypothetical protein
MEDLQVSWKSITNANRTHTLQASVGMSDMRLPADNIRGRGRSGLSEIVEEEHLRFEPTIAPANSAITTPSLPLSPTNFQHRRNQLQMLIGHTRYRRLLACLI